MDNDATVIEGAGNFSELPSGTLLENYRIERLLGRGGMGAVYEAEQVRLGRHYALKVLPLELSQDVSFQRRFESEARLLAQLEHPNIVGIHYAGDAPYRGGKISYLVMERLYPLTGWLSEQSRVGEDEVGSILMQVLDALIYAHGRGLVHRDLKPANLLMTQEGEIKVGDFGVAQVVGEQYMRTLVERTVAQSRLGDASTVVSRSSAGSDYAGTLHYMAPEVISGLGATARSDLYAVGVMAYEWLTGRKPIGRYKDVSVLNPGLGKAWDDWVNRLLEPEPEERYETAGAALEALVGLINREAQEVDTGHIPPPFADPSPAKTAAQPPEPSSSVTSTLRESSDKSVVPELSQPPVVVDLGGVSMDLLWIPPGEFVMGSPVEGDNDERPVTTVRFTQGFWLGKTPVTQEQWQALMGKNPSYFKGPTLPVENVSWGDAMTFCHRLTEREQAAGRLPEGYVYTLPSEAQWEYAARAGTTTRWSFGDDESQLDDYAWFKGNSKSKTHPVFNKRPNPWGLYDMHGNVWEWTRSWFESYRGGSVTAYEGPGKGGSKVNRGGSWCSASSSSRSARRDGDTPGRRSSYLGFRLALTPFVPVDVPNQNPSSAWGCATLLLIAGFIAFLLDECSGAW